MSGNDIDRTLLSAAAEGDQGALSGLYDRYVAFLLAIAVRMLGNAEDAEDLVHDVFIEAWQRAGGYDPARGTVKTWLAMRARSRCLDRIRSRQAAVRGRRYGPPAEAQAPTQERDAQALRAVTIIETLPRAQRVVLEQSFFEGLSATEIATRAALPVGTVKSRLAAGMKVLRASVRHEGEGLESKVDDD